MRLPAPLVGALLAAVLIADVAALALHDDSTPYTPQQALQDFRAQPSAPAHSAATAPPSTGATASPSPDPVAPAAPTPTPRPAASPAAVASAGPEPVTPGVYAYRTSGHEQVDILGGSRHDYPAETTMTYRRTPCGVQVRWQPLQDRYSTDDVCHTVAGGQLSRAFQRHTFFGQSDDEDLLCSRGLILVPTEPRAGQASTGTCRGKVSVVALRIEVLGLTRTDVGGTSVEVVHVMVTGRLSGGARGTTKREVWLTRGGLTVRTISYVDSDRDTQVGSAHYVEQYELNLRSLEPQS